MISLIKNDENFWAEVALRAANNYGNFGTGEEIEVNVSRAIDDILADVTKELKDSTEAIEVKYKIRLANNLD